MALSPGTCFGPYEILSLVGAGGMGEVYKARDTRLGRTVAIKISNGRFSERLEREARAAAALNHPNIATLYDIGEHQGCSYLVMEFVEGRPLKQLIGPTGLPLGQVLRHALQIADATAMAHAAGIIHRDLKPANIMITTQGVVKVLDFGLAKLAPRAADSDEAVTQTLESETEAGALVGTVAYMSPEQAEGKKLDGRSDVFSLGVVLYEMLAGHRPFEGNSSLSVITAILRDEPPALGNLPAEMERIVSRCLKKSPELRYQSARELCQDLARCRSRLESPGLLSLLRRPRFAIAAIFVLLLAAGAVVWLGVRTSRVRWARNVALPEATRLQESGQFYDAFRLARQLASYIPEDPQLQRVLRDSTAPVTIRTSPAGAEVLVKGYLSKAEWFPVGRTPLEGVRVPIGYNRWQIGKPGFDTLEAAFPGTFGVDMQFALDAPGTAPTGMVRIPGGKFQFRSAPEVELPEYWLDKYEVTNRQFKEFVDQGGYSKREYWKDTLEGGSASAFRDTTGRPGPSTWELGTYPEGRADYPVSGVSWHEAAAYCEFAGKSLPTVYHWYKAAGIYVFADILRASNFGSGGPAPVGTYQGLSPRGNYDMAGNVKEWCWNRTGAAPGSSRYILGGAWNEPNYMFYSQDAARALDRPATYGFRCAKYTAPPTAILTDPIKNLSRDYAREKPVGEEVFRIYRSLYSYDRTDLTPVIESADDTNPHWRKEKISFNAAYGGERMLAYLYLPKNGAPPYQTVIYFPGSTPMRLRSSENLAETRLWDYIPRSGRAVFYPIYKGFYERRLPGRDPSLEEWVVRPGGTGITFGPNTVKDLIVYWSKDLGRAIDYLETRKDIDASRLAYYGLSLGGFWGPVLTAIEARFKASVLVGGGMIFEELPSEVEAIHFAPRVKTPTLMLNGSNDFLYPVATSQIPLFRMLGVPEKEKRHVLFDSGHVPPRDGVVKETLDWLDRYLGPVK